MLTMADKLMTERSFYAANTDIALIKLRWPSGRVFPQLLLEVAHCIAPSLESFLALWCLADNLDGQHWIGGKPIVTVADRQLRKSRLTCNASPNPTIG